MAYKQPTRDAIRLRVCVAFSATRQGSFNLESLRERLACMKSIKDTKETQAYRDGYVDAQMVQLWDEWVTFGYIDGGTLYTVNEPEALPPGILWKRIDHGLCIPGRGTLDRADRGAFWRHSGKLFAPSRHGWALISKGT